MIIQSNSLNTLAKTGMSLCISFYIHRTIGKFQEIGLKDLYSDEKDIVRTFGLCEINEPKF